MPYESAQCRRGSRRLYIAELGFGVGALRGAGRQLSNASEAARGRRGEIGSEGVRSAA